MQKHANIVEWFSINKSQVKVIFVDETLIQIDGGQDYYWLWISYEPNMDLCLMMHTYHLRICYQFFKELRKRFGRKIIFTDDAIWYIMMVLVNG